MSCQELTEVLSDYIEEQLTRAEAAWTEEHLAQCDACRAYLDQLRETIAALRSLGEAERAEPVQLERILAALR